MSSPLFQPAAPSLVFTQRRPPRILSEAALLLHLSSPRLPSSRPWKDPLVAAPFFLDAERSTTWDAADGGPLDLDAVGLSWDWTIFYICK